MFNNQGKKVKIQKKQTPLQGERETHTHTYRASYITYMYTTYSQAPPPRLLQQMKTAGNQSKNSFTPKKFALSGQIQQSSIAANLLCKFQEKSMSKNLMKCSHVLMFSLSLSLCVFVCSARVYLRLSQLVGVAARCGWRWIDELFFFSCCTHQVLLHQLLLLLMMITKDHHQQNQTHNKTQQQTTSLEV